MRVEEAEAEEEGETCSRRKKRLTECSRSSSCFSSTSSASSRCDQHAA